MKKPKLLEIVPLLLHLLHLSNWSYKWQHWWLWWYGADIGGSNSDDVGVVQGIASFYKKMFKYRMYIYNIDISLSLYFFYVLPCLILYFTHCYIHEQNYCKWDGWLWWPYSADYLHHHHYFHQCTRFIIINIGDRAVERIFVQVYALCLAMKIITIDMSDDMRL